MDAANLHSRSVEEFLSRLETVGDRWSAPTPCSEWDVRALVNHVVAEDLWTAPLMTGATIEEVGDRFEGDVLGDDPMTIARAAADAAVTATASAVVAGRTVHLSFGETPAEEYAYQLAADHVIHGWDLAAATGGDRRFGPELVEGLAAWFVEREELFRSSGAIAERPPDGGSSNPQDRLLEAFGRRPRWAPAPTPER
jgi:uncharacterized protein (TIGR03086 family)